METPSSPMAPLLLRNLLTSIFLHADKPLFYLSRKYTPLQTLRWFLASTFLFFLQLLPSLFPSLNPSSKPTSKDHHETAPRSISACKGESGVSRALSQLLLIMNDIPVSSRKYELVRSLAEKLIDENALEKSQVLKEVNCAVLSTAFERTLSQLEDAVRDQERSGGGEDKACGSVGESDGYLYGMGRRLFKGVKGCGRAMWRYAKLRDELRGTGSSAEKLAAELLWLAQKMAASGCADGAVGRWASAGNLAWLALSAEPRLQGSLVKVSAFLIKQAKEIGNDQGGVDKTSKTPIGSEQHQFGQMKMKMLISWLPLLCRANNGTDAPILNMGERAEIERVLGDIIVSLEEEEQERVLALWLHHFTYCSASDWPNLRACYTRWFRTSRDRLLQDPKNSLSS